MPGKTPPYQSDDNREKLEANFEEADFSSPDLILGEQDPISGKNVVFQTEEAIDPQMDSPAATFPRNLSFILDIPLEISVELGRTRMRIADILKLGQGSIIELTNPAGSSLEVLVNQKPIAKGEVVVVNEKYGIRLIEILSIMERIEKLK